VGEGAAGRSGDVRQLNVRVPAGLLAEAKKRAIDLDITLAEAVAEAIAEWLDRHSSDGGA
jgi:post-segregation antitoxin (ccd killing protein)